VLSGIKVRFGEDASMWNAINGHKRVYGSQFWDRLQGGECCGAPSLYRSPESWLDWFGGLFGRMSERIAFQGTFMLWR
jgi:hypothetical protein